MEILDPDLWNDDGTPKRPSMQDTTVTAFADLAADERYMSYARMQSEMRKNTTPDIGDVVHYWTGTRCLPALVLDVASLDVDADLLRILTPHSADVDERVDHNEGKSEGTWHWPESR